MELIELDELSRFSKVLLNNSCSQKISNKIQPMPFVIPRKDCSALYRNTFSPVKHSRR
jgi:hypothetical protein